MNKGMMCKNCKYHYVEEISFDYPQSCCSKRMATTEEWCKCDAFEYGDRYVEQLQQENKKQKEVIDKITSRLEYYLIGNLKYQSAQEEFVKLLDILKGGSDE
jgi:hypothetical protein